MPQATHFPSKGRNESVSSGPRGPRRANTHRSSLGCWESGRTPQHPETPEGSLAADGTLWPQHHWDGGLGKPRWHRGDGGLGFFSSPENHRARFSSSPLPTAPISSLHLHSSGSQGFWQAFCSSFYWFQLSCPFRRVGKLQSLKETRRKKKKKEKKKASCTLHPAVPSPLPRWPHTTHSRHTSLFSKPNSAPPMHLRQGFQGPGYLQLYLLSSNHLPARKQFRKDTAQVAIS